MRRRRGARLAEVLDGAPTLIRAGAARSISPRMKIKLAVSSIRRVS